MRGVLDGFTGLKALVVGDVMIDAYMKGVIERMSPEAPVPIVRLNGRFFRLGGAANVALNLKALGAIPFLCSVIGDDEKGRELLSEMERQGLPSGGMIASRERVTTVKQRVLNGDRQVLRIDEEDDFDLTEQERHALLHAVEELLDSQPFDIILLQDYNKGVLSMPVIERLLSLARRHHIPVAVDPKKKNFFAYQGVELFKPNAKELREGLGVDAETLAELQSAALQLQERLGCHYLMVTLSEQGVLILEKTAADEKVPRFLHLPAHHRNIVDVSGAGDTVLSVAALCTALRQDARTIASLSNMAGGLVCEEAGVVPIDKDKLSNEVERLSKHHD